MQLAKMTQNVLHGRNLLQVSGMVMVMLMVHRGDSLQAEGQFFGVLFPLAESFGLVYLLVHASSALDHIIHVLYAPAHFVLVLLPFELKASLIVNRANVQMMPVSLEVALLDSLEDQQTFL